MGNFIGIDGVNAKLVECSEDMPPTAANAARQPTVQPGEIVADPLTTDNRQQTGVPCRLSPFFWYNRWSVRGRLASTGVVEAVEACRGATTS